MFSPFPLRHPTPSAAQRICKIGVLFLLLLLLGACQSTDPPPAQINVIHTGQTVKGTLSQSENRWLFVGQRDDVISIEFTVSGGTAPQVVLLDAGGESAARVTNSTGKLDGFRLPANGTYSIVIASGTGSYSLTLRQNTNIAASVPTPPPVATSSGRFIGIGESRTGTLPTPDTLDIWALNGTAGSVITVQMNAAPDTLDPLLRFYAPDGSLLASDDNSGGALNAMLAGIKLPVSGTYLIQASGSGRVGDYVLNVQPGAFPTATPQPPTPPPQANVRTGTPGPTPIPILPVGAQIRIGQTIEGLIAAPQDVDRFAVFGPAGTTISIGMFRLPDSKLIPAFEIYGPSGRQLFRASGNGTAVIAGYTLPVTGAYIIYPAADGNQSSGRYTLSVGEGYTLRDFNVGAMNTDSAVQGTIARTGDRHTWQLKLAANATFSAEVSVAQVGFEPVVDVIGPDGKQIAAAFFNAQTRRTLIPAFVTPMEGIYQIRVASVAGKPGGAYTLQPRLLRVLPTATFALTVNQTLEAEVAQHELYSYSFKAVPGVVAIIEAKGKNSFDPVIILYGPSGKRLAIAGNSDPNVADPVLQLALDDGIGTYTVQVHGYAMTPGAFTLRVKTE